jgi:hypothetical protein
MRPSLNDVVDDYVVDYFGDFIIESIDRMLNFSDYSFQQKLAVVEGAIALGNWTNSPRQQEALREIRSTMIEEYEND